MAEKPDPWDEAMTSVLYFHIASGRLGDVRVGSSGKSEGSHMLARAVLVKIALLVVCCEPQQLWYQPAAVSHHSALAGTGSL